MTPEARRDLADITQSVPTLIDGDGDQWYICNMDEDGMAGYSLYDDCVGHARMTIDRIEEDCGINWAETWELPEAQAWVSIRGLAPENPADATGEVRIVNPDTGGAKGSKLARFDLIPAGAMWDVACHYGIGAEKYDDNNWRRGYNWSLSLAALERHLVQFKGGEDFDDETGSPHMAAVVFHALALLTFMDEHRELDDRWEPQ